MSDAGPPGARVRPHVAEPHIGVFFVGPRKGDYVRRSKRGRGNETYCLGGTVFVCKTDGCTDLGPTWEGYSPGPKVRGSVRGSITTRV